MVSSLSDQAHPLHIGDAMGEVRLQVVRLGGHQVLRRGALRGPTIPHADGMKASGNAQPH